MNLRKPIGIAMTLVALAGASAAAQARECCDDIYVQSGPSSDFVLGMTVGTFAGFALSDGFDHHHYDDRHYGHHHYDDRYYDHRRDEWRWRHHWRGDPDRRWYSYNPHPAPGRPYWQDNRDDHRDEGRHGGHDSRQHWDNSGHSGGWVDHYNRR